MRQAAKTQLSGALLSGLVLIAGAVQVVGAEVVRKSRATGVARFVASADGKPIPIPLPAGRQQTRPLDFFRTNGGLFGITDPDQQLIEKEAVSDHIGRTRTTFQQMHDGVPVFAGVLRVHSNATGGIVAVNGTFIPDLKVNTTPVLTADAAAAAAIALVSDQKPAAGLLLALGKKLYVYRINLARGVPGPNALVYEVEVGNGINVREFVYIDAHKGHVVDQVTGIHDALSRNIYDGGFDAGTLVWSDGDSPYAGGDVDVERLIEYTEDTYNIVASATDGMYLSYDGNDVTMEAVANTPFMNCPNASWNGIFAQFCTGVAPDDIVAHEWGHAYTEKTHGLIYAWQPGALNESYSDIFAETIDLLNGAGTDAPDVVRTAGDCSIYAGSPPPTLTINSPVGIAGVYPSSGAVFNPAPPLTLTADVELVNDGTGAITDGCEALIGYTPGNIALIDRGTCSFVTKAQNAANAGAAGVIIANNAGDTSFLMGGAGAPGIPSIMIGQSDGGTIKAVLPGVSATITLDVSTADSYRWLQGEDASGFGGAIRDLWNPNCMSDPGRVGDSSVYHCGTSDGGGVHTNSGIPNHAFALLVDGGTYNAQTIIGLGMTKAFQIYWRAASVYQVPASGFSDHADALEQSCSDLIGVNLFALSAAVPTGTLSGEIMTSGDCDQVAKVILAVELRDEPTSCGFTALLDPNAPALCGAGTVPDDLFTEDWESGLGAWTVGTRDEADPATFDTPDWAVVGSLPDGRAGSAAFVEDILSIGDCAADTEAGVLFLESPVIAIPLAAGAVHMSFDHWVATEFGWDGGNVKISVNGGAYAIVGSGNFLFNAYNTVLNVSDDPLGGEEAFSGSDGGSITGSWGQSQVDLTGIATAGDDIQLRFEMGLDGCNGLVGWYVDDVHVFECVVEDCNGNAVPDDLETDTDGDGLIDDCDTDDDNDGVADVDDLDALNPDICEDLDGDTCDDCAVGTDDFGPLPDNDPANDGPDSDGDGICDASGSCNAACVWDIDGSGEVRVPDLIVLLACWGPLTGDPDCECLDIDTSGDIRVPDLIAMLAKWGLCP